MSDSSTFDPPSRAALRSARRVCVKAGTSVVANEDGRPSLVRLGAIAEQIAELSRSGVQVIFVSSGAVGMGKRVLRKQSQLSMSIMDLHKEEPCPKEEEMRRSSGSFASLLNLNARPHSCTESKRKTYDSACAAAGQFEMMNLYSSLFDQVDITASQVLVTQSDFSDPDRLHNLTYAVDRLLSLGIVPIINENDAVSANLGYTSDDIFSDNDSLAALCAKSFHAEVLVLLTDVEGVFDSSPKDNPKAKLLQYYSSSQTKVNIGSKSAQGRGGMASKIDAALRAVNGDKATTACVVVSGNDLNSIRAILGPDPKYGTKGTLFVKPGSELEKQAMKDHSSSTDSKKEMLSGLPQEARNQAIASRNEARKLQAMPIQVRQAILHEIANALLQRKAEILSANAIDVSNAASAKVDDALQKRLLLTDTKIATLAMGLTQIAEMSDPLGVVKAKRELADGLVLTQITVPIGVLLIIFESRPDSMPQISALALASGNGLLLKGGKEAVYSNAILHRIIGDAIEASTDGKIKRDIIALITSRNEVADMLQFDSDIDLVIPRGSNALVSYIKANTRIPVLGHADGVCHVYISSCASADSASKIAVDAKTDYPSACNAMETLLLHKDCIDNCVASSVLMALRKAGVVCLGGPAAMKLGLADQAAKELKCEYGNLTCMVEVVENLDDAIDWIHAYGSGHSESIVCANTEIGEEFMRRVDAACVFLNASTRFADGFRFGLGAEVGISTGRIHARGPVGVEGLLTTKWQLRSSDGKINYVAEFSGDDAKKKYTHNELL